MSSGDLYHFGSRPVTILGVGLFGGDDVRSNLHPVGCHIYVYSAPDIITLSLLSPLHTASNHITAYI